MAVYFYEAEKVVQLIQNAEFEASPLRYLDDRFAGQVDLDMRNELLLTIGLALIRKGEIEKVKVVLNVFDLEEEEEQEWWFWLNYHLGQHLAHYDLNLADRWYEELCDQVQDWELSVGARIGMAHWAFTKMDSPNRAKSWFETLGIDEEEDLDVDLAELHRIRVESWELCFLMYRLFLEVTEIGENWSFPKLPKEVRFRYDEISRWEVQEALWNLAVGLYRNDFTTISENWYTLVDRFNNHLTSQEKHMTRRQNFYRSIFRHLPSRHGFGEVFRQVIEQHWQDVEEEEMLVKREQIDWLLVLPKQAEWQDWVINWLRHYGQEIPSVVSSVEQLGFFHRNFLAWVQLEERSDAQASYEKMIDIAELEPLLSGQMLVERLVWAEQLGICTEEMEEIVQIILFLKRDWTYSPSLLSIRDATRKLLRIAVRWNPSGAIRLALFVAQKGILDLDEALCHVIGESVQQVRVSTLIACLNEGVFPISVEAEDEFDENVTGEIVCAIVNQILAQQSQDDAMQTMMHWLKLLPRESTYTRSIQWREQILKIMLLLERVPLLHVTKDWWDADYEDQCLQLKNGDLIAYDEVFALIGDDYAQLQVLLDEEAESAGFGWEPFLQKFVDGNDRRAIEMADRFKGKRLRISVLHEITQVLMDVGEHDRAYCLAEQMLTGEKSLVASVQIVEIMILIDRAKGKKAFWDVLKQYFEKNENVSRLLYVVLPKVMEHLCERESLLQVKEAFDQVSQRLLASVTDQVYDLSFLYEQTNRESVEFIFNELPERIRMERM